MAATADLDQRGLVGWHGADAVDADVVQLLSFNNLCSLDTSARSTLKPEHWETILTSPAVKGLKQLVVGAECLLSHGNILRLARFAIDSVSMRLLPSLVSLHTLIL